MTTGNVNFFGTTEDGYFLLDANVNIGFTTTTDCNTDLFGPPGKSGSCFSVPFPRSENSITSPKKCL